MSSVIQRRRHTGITAGAKFLADRIARYPWRVTIDNSTVRPEEVERGNPEWKHCSAVVTAGTRTYAFTYQAHRDAFAAKYNGRVY